MQNLDLFTWWAISISWGIVFLIIIAFYLYVGSRSKREESSRTSADKAGLGKDFVFVWVLIGLLFFYIFTVKIGSSLIFAVGNIVVESILIIYLVRNKSEKSEEKSGPSS